VDFNQEQFQAFGDGKPFFGLATTVLRVSNREGKMKEAEAFLMTQKADPRLGFDMQDLWTTRLITKPNLRGANIIPGVLLSWDRAPEGYIKSL
jgi:hypothetical protein